MSETNSPHPEHTDSGLNAEPGIARLAELIQEETEALMIALPDAIVRQWNASPVPKPREDTQQRASGGRPDPTADIVADPRRLAVRETVIRSEAVLRQALVALRGSRLALARSVARYDGDGNVS